MTVRRRSTIRGADVARVAAVVVLLALPACGERADDGLSRITLSLAGPPPPEPAQDVRVQLDGPTRIELSVRTGDEAELELPPGEYAVRVNGQEDVCPDRVDLTSGDREVSLLWPVAGACPAAPPAPPDGPGPVPPAPPPPGAPGG